jgi:L-threonine kinase
VEEKVRDGGQRLKDALAKLHLPPCKFIKIQNVIPNDSFSVLDRYPASITGKVGEFLQGVRRDGSPILYSATILSPEITTYGFVVPAPSFRVLIESQPSRIAGKTERAIRTLLLQRCIEQPWDFEVRIRSSSPFAKGLGTSSADMGAGLLAVAQYLSLGVTEAELFSIMCAVERSDFLFRPDTLVCANPLSAEISIEGPAPRLTLLGWDSEPERRIATEAVACLDHRRIRYASEYLELTKYCNSGEIEALLFAMTRSAEINQEFLPKPCFPWARNVARGFGAALIVAHSGTFMAFAIPQSGDEVDRIAEMRGMLIANGFVPLVFHTGDSRGKIDRRDLEKSAILPSG